jgi:hypothetical protein
MASTSAEEKRSKTRGEVVLVTSSNPLNCSRLERGRYFRNSARKKRSKKSEIRQNKVKMNNNNN